MALDLEALYTDLHAHPELSLAEHRTAGVIAEQLTALGIDHVTGIGGTGIVATLVNREGAHGDGPVVWLRADTDGLPVEELTGLPYASKARGIDPDGNDVPVMHACGHDMHITALLGALEQLQATKDDWSGTVVAIFQPAEEVAAGARAMLEDGMLDRFPRPDIVLGQHLTDLPAGSLTVCSGRQMAATDGLSVVFHGRGGHGSAPHTTIDPIVMAASAILRLQTVVARGISPNEMAVVTVGSIHAGLKNNIIPGTARIDLSLRYPDDQVREQVIEQVTRIVKAEALASGAEVEPTITTLHQLPPTINDADATARLVNVWSQAFGADALLTRPPTSGSEDVSWFSCDAGVPLVYWFFGGVDPEQYAAAEQAGRVDEDIPSNHSAYFAPVLHPTIERAVDALTLAAREFLG